MKPIQLISFDQNKRNYSNIQKLSSIRKPSTGSTKPIKINTSPSSLLSENIELEKVISSIEYCSIKIMDLKLDPPSMPVPKDSGCGLN